jgi:hypothetical protein
MNCKRQNDNLAKPMENIRFDIKNDMMSDEEKYGEEDQEPWYDDIIYEQLRERQIFKDK